MITEAKQTVTARRCHSDEAGWMGAGAAYLAKHLLSPLSNLSQSGTVTCMLCLWQDTDDVLERVALASPPVMSASR